MGDYVYIRLRFWSYGAGSTSTDSDLHEESGYRFCASFSWQEAQFIGSDVEPPRAAGRVQRYAFLGNSMNIAHGGISRERIGGCRPRYGPSAGQFPRPLSKTPPGLSIQFFEGSRALIWFLRNSEDSVGFIHCHPYRAVQAYLLTVYRANREAASPFPSLAQKGETHNLPLEEQSS